MNYKINTKPLLYDDLCVGKLYQYYDLLDSKKNIVLILKKYSMLSFGSCNLCFELQILLKNKIYAIPATGVSFYYIFKEL